MMSSTASVAQSRYTVEVASTVDLLASLRACRTIDLAQPYYVGAPHHPAHPAYLYSLNKKHGDYVNPGGASSAADAIALGTHVGTHIDALCHFSCNGQLHGGIDVAGVQSYAGGVERHTIDRVEPLVRRGVLLDVARAEGVEILPKDFAIRPEHLEKCGVKVLEGDVVLIRTGWAKFWDDAAKFISEVNSPGPALEGAKWLSGRRVFATGSDTAPFEFAPSPEMSVHVHLLVESGIHIIECLNLEELSASGATEFLFIALPLKIRGGTGSPIRPIALIAT
jgi:kynurenine formamidase